MQNSCANLSRARESRIKQLEITENKVKEQPHRALQRSQWESIEIVGGKKLHFEKLAAAAAAAALNSSRKKEKIKLEIKLGERDDETEKKNMIYFFSWSSSSFI